MRGTDVGRWWVVVPLVVLSLGAGREVPLVEAVKQGNTALVRTLLRSGDVDATEADGSTALHWATHRNDVATVDLLVRAGANVNATTRYGITPLWLAAENGSAAVLERLLKAGADVNAAVPGGETPLLTAARVGSGEAVKVLLAYGANVNAAESTRRQTALMWAAAEGNTEAARVLIEAGAEIRARSTQPKSQKAERLDRVNPLTNPAPRNSPLTAEDTVRPAAQKAPTPLEHGALTPLLFAVRRGQIDTVKLLLEAGADVNDEAVVLEGFGPANALMLAVVNGHYELAAYLLDKGADPNHAGQGWTALHQLVVARAERGKNRTHRGWMAGPQLTGNLSGVDLAKKLIARGVDVNARSTREVQNGYSAAAAAPRTGATPLMLAAKVVDHELMRVLLANGADPNIPQITHTTPLMAAAGVGMKAPGEDGGSNEDALESVKLLLDFDVKISEANDQGWTPLHGAAFRGSNDIVQLLIDRGANIKARTKHGRFQNDPGVTPLGIATGITIGVVFFRQELTAEFLRKLYVARGIPLDPDETGIWRGLDPQAKTP